MPLLLVLSIVIPQLLYPFRPALRCKKNGLQPRCCAGTNSRIALAQMNSQAEKARGHDNQRLGNLPLAENREGSCRDRRSP